MIANGIIFAFVFLASNVVPFLSGNSNWSVLFLVPSGNIPITFFSFDEQSGLDGIKTRLEFFYDLLNFKREE